MTKEEYIAYKNNINVNFMHILYSYYMEKYRGKTVLDFNMFSLHMSRQPRINEYIQKAVREYDIKFEIITVQDVKTGQILKYI